MNRMFSCLLVTSLFSSFSYSELVPLSTDTLDRTYGRIDFISPDSLAEGIQEQISLGSDMELTQGIEIDLDIQMSLDMEWKDGDGLPRDGVEGSEGSLILSGMHFGSRTDPLTGADVQNDTPFQSTDLAIVRDLFIEVDSKQGMFITLNELGDDQGNGLDIIVNDIYLGDRSASAGGLLIEDVSNFVTHDQLANINRLFGSQLRSVDDGKGTVNGNWVPFEMLVKTKEGGEDFESPSFDLPDLDVPLQDVGLPSFSANTEISASFVLGMNKLAWVDDGNEFGLSGVLIYDGIDTDNDGVDDLLGPAKLTNMKLETVDHTAWTGEQVKALHIANLDFKADIAIESIYVGDPVNGSLGSLQIKGLDTSGTSIWIYGH